MHSFDAFWKKKQKEKKKTPKTSEGPSSSSDSVGTIRVSVLFPRGETLSLALRGTGTRPRVQPGIYGYKKEKTNLCKRCSAKVTPPPIRRRTGSGAGDLGGRGGREGSVVDHKACALRRYGFASPRVSLFSPIIKNSFNSPQSKGQLRGSAKWSQVNSIRQNRGSTEVA